MATRIWNGTTAAFGTAAAWSPEGVPASGDTATINSGSVTITGTDLAPNVTVQLNHAGAGASLAFSNATIGVGDTVVLLESDPGSTTLRLTGNVTNSGLLSFQRTPTITGYNSLSVTLSGTSIAQPGILTNNGEIDLFAQGTNFYSAAGSYYGGQIVNNGSIVIRNQAATKIDNYSINGINFPIMGTGSIAIGTAARLSL